MAGIESSSGPSDKRQSSRQPFCMDLYLVLCKVQIEMTRFREAMEAWEGRSRFGFWNAAFQSNNPPVRMHASGPVWLAATRLRPAVCGQTRCQAHTQAVTGSLQASATVQAGPLKSNQLDPGHQPPQMLNSSASSDDCMHQVPAYLGQLGRAFGLAVGLSRV